jgi:uncharacterized protein (DUF433 family)
MKWKEYIHTDSEVLAGKPVIKNTRLSVEFLIERLADGWAEQDLLDNYPQLTPTHLQAVFLYLLENMRDGLFLYPEKQQQ